MDRVIELLYIGNALVSHGVAPTSADFVPDLLRKEGVKVRVASSKKNIYFRLLDMLWAIVRYSRKTDYVVIDTYSTKNFWYAFLCARLCRILKIKYIPVLHGGGLPRRLERSRRMANSILFHSYCNVSPSRYLQAAVKRSGYSARIIPNPIQVAAYPFKMRTTLRPHLLFVRAFAGVYNPTMALNVLKAVMDEHPKAKLCMVGPDKDGTLDQCVRFAKELGITEHIQFTGKLKRKDWHKLSEDYDIFVNTANIDNAPVSVVEAMALGLPVISTNPGGMPYLIDNESDGILVPVGDVDAMAEKVVSLLRNPDGAISIALNARAKAEKFDWANIKDEWADLLR